MKNRIHLPSWLLAIITIGVLTGCSASTQASSNLSSTPNIACLFAAHLSNALLMIGMPVALAIVLGKRWKLGARLWFIGAATFILSQVGHIPFNALFTSVVNRTALVNMSTGAALVFNSIYIGLSAGLFEELCRYGMFRWWAKDARSWRKGVLAGAGHGGIEAIIFGSIALFTFVQFALARTADLAQPQVAAYWSTSWYGSMLGALQRLFAIPTQIAFSLIVMQAFIRRQSFWLWLAVIYHAALDGLVTYVSATAGTLPAYVFMAVFALVNVFLIFRLRRSEPGQATTLPDAIPAR